MNKLSLFSEYGFPLISIAFFTFIIVIPLDLKAQATASFKSDPAASNQFLTPGLSAMMLSSKLSPEETQDREARCLHTAEWVGLAAGSGIGLLHTFWSFKYPSAPDIPVWKHLVVGLPATLVSGYVGMRTTKWATRQLLQGQPKPWRAAIKGAGFGALDGTIILAASYIPFFILGHYLGTIHFNNLSEDWIVIKLIGVSALGGAAYGGTMGALVGAVSGPCISWYMKF